MREETRRRREEAEHNARLEEAVVAFDAAIGSVYRQSHDAMWERRPFDPAPHVPQVAARLGEALNVLRESGRLGVLDGIDFDLTFNHYRNHFPEGHARQALDFAVRCLRGAIEGNRGGFDELVRELFLDESVQPAGKWFRLLLSMLAGRLRYEPKASDVRCEPCEGAKDQQADVGAASGVVETDPTTLPFIQIASDVPDLGEADSLPEFWEWCNRHRDGLRRFRVRLGLRAPASVATDEFRVIPEIVHQCRSYLIGFGAEGIPDRFAFPRLPYDQTPTGPEHFPSPMEAFLVWASAYRTPGHEIMKLIGEVEEFLSWAMGSCQQQQTRTEEPALLAKDAEAPRPPSQEWYFSPSGNGYYITGFGESGHLSGRKGLSDLARLIQARGKLVPMLELEGANQQQKRDRRSCQPSVDTKELQQAAERLQELRVDLEQALKENNSVEADTTRAEIEQLESSLRSAKGLGGKVRDLNNLFDKLRPKIHGRLRTVYEAMRKADPPMNKLAEHFELSISCEGGRGFIYRPAGDPPPWLFQRATEK
jgi:hypothetical protein